MQSKKIRSSLFVLAVLAALCLITVVAHSENGDDHLVCLPLAFKPPPAYLVWVSKYEGPGMDSAWETIASRDGTFVTVGYSTSSPYPGLVLRSTRDGDIVWQKAHQIGGAISDVVEAGDGSLLVATLGGSYYDAAVIKQGPDGNVLWRRALTSGVDAGEIDDVDGGAVIVTRMSYTSWVWRLDDRGDSLWTKEYGQASNTQLQSIQHTSDGGYIVAGAKNGQGWVLKLHPDGEIAWQKVYDGEASEFIDSIRQTSDGGYIAAGNLWDTAWILRLKHDGTVIWSRRFDMADDDQFFSVTEMSDKGFVAVGDTKTYEPYGTKGWAVRLDSSGEIQWQRRYDLHGLGLRSVERVPAGGLMFAGMGGEMFLLRTDDGGYVPACDLIETADGIASDYPLTVSDSATSPLTLDARSSNFNSYIDEGSLVRKSLCPALTIETVDD